MLHAVTTQEADRRGRSVELGQLVLLRHLPKPRRRKVNGRRFDDCSGDTV
jgi:hypothetical protein